MTPAYGSPCVTLGSPLRVRNSSHAVTPVTAAAPASAPAAAPPGGSVLVRVPLAGLTVRLAIMTLICGRCGNPSAHTLKKYVTKFTLFFVPH